MRFFHLAIKLLSPTYCLHQVSINQTSTSILQMITLVVKFMLHSINLSLMMPIFLSKVWRFYNFLSKTFNDLSFPCQGLQGSFKFLSRSLRIFKSLTKIFNLLVKNFKDLSFSCLDLQRSFIFLPRSLRIFKISSKISGDWWQDCSGSWQENKRSLKILERKWEILKDLNLKNLEDLQKIFKYL